MLPDCQSTFLFIHLAWAPPQDTAQAISRCAERSEKVPIVEPLIFSEATPLKSPCDQARERRRRRRLRC